MHRVFIDSNVLGSRTLFDWLFLLRSESEMFNLTTTPDVLDETHRVWRRKHPSAGGEQRRLREEKFRECFDDIVDDWDGGEAPNLRDVDDQHVHNAAKHCNADILLTANVKDFGDPDQLPYDLYTPDEFFCLVDGSSPFLVREITRRQNAYWQGRRDKGHPVKSLVESLQSAGCPEFALRVADHLRVLAGQL